MANERDKKRAEQLHVLSIAPPSMNKTIHQVALLPIHQK